LLENAQFWYCSDDLMRASPSAHPSADFRRRHFVSQGWQGRYRTGVWKAPPPSDVFGAQEDVAYVEWFGKNWIQFNAKHSDELCKVIIGVARPL
jgi:hypothetical protein